MNSPKTHLRVNISTFFKSDRVVFLYSFSTEETENVLVIYEARDQLFCYIWTELDSSFPGFQSLLQS